MRRPCAQSCHRDDLALSAVMTDKGNTKVVCITIGVAALVPKINGSLSLLWERQ